jgi:hypothetical protein
MPVNTANKVAIAFRGIAGQDSYRFEFDISIPAFPAPRGDSQA